MKKIELEELKKLQLDILIEVDEYCQQYGYRYSLAYGTLIGAIRHKGYIPWDDDIDIIMPRADYERFVKEFKSLSGDLAVISPYSNGKFYAPYANVVNTKTVLYEDVYHGLEIGVKIDVFPVDNVPDTKDGQVELFRGVKKITRRINIMASHGKGITDSIKARIFYLVTKIFFPFRSYSRILNEYAKSSNAKYVASNYVNNIVWCAAKEKGCFKKEDLNSYIDMEFEGHKFKALAGYDDFLSTHYGNYMELPPIEKRVTHHKFEAYWK